MTSTAITILTALAALAIAVSARAQAPADSYKVGEKVEVRPVPAKDAWEPGVVTDFTYDTGQLVVRWPANERAFEDKDVRHLPPPSAQPAESAKPRAPATRAAMSRASEATPPDDGPIPAAPRR